MDGAKMEKSRKVGRVESSEGIDGRNDGDEEKMRKSNIKGLAKYDRERRRACRLPGSGTRLELSARSQSMREG